MSQTVAAFMLDRLATPDAVEQAQGLAHALPGDPARGQIIRNALEGKIDGLVHR